VGGDDSDFYRDWYLLDDGDDTDGEVDEEDGDTGSDEEEDDDNKNIPPIVLRFGPLPNLQDEVQVIGYPTGGDSMSVTSGIVSRIERQEYAQAGMHLLAIQIDAAINPGNSGGPVLNDKLEVVGVAFQTLGEGENIGYVVPVTVVYHFLEDARRRKERIMIDGDKYEGGFCGLGIRYELLENRALRKSLGMGVEVDYRGEEDEEARSSINSGVLIGNMAPTSRAYRQKLLQTNDVITAIDGIPIANDGKIPFRHGERVSLLCYIQTKFQGDIITVDVLRRSNGNGNDNDSDNSNDNENDNDSNNDNVQQKISPPQTLSISVPVSPYRLRVPAHFQNRPPPYLIVSGLVFTVLSVPLLDAWGAWDEYISDGISYLLGLNDGVKEKEEDEVVVLSQVLVHRENLGYDKYAAMHLTKVNGVRVRNLRHLEGLINGFCAGEEGVGKDVGGFMGFQFAPHDTTIVLECSNVGRVTEEVCLEQSIAKPSFFLHDATRDNDDDADDKDKDKDKDNDDGAANEGEVDSASAILADNELTVSISTSSPNGINTTQ